MEAINVYFKRTGIVYNLIASFFRDEQEQEVTIV